MSANLSPGQQVFSSGHLFRYLDSFQDSYEHGCAEACKNVHGVMEGRRVEAITARRDQLLAEVSREASYLATINATIERDLGEIRAIMEMYPNSHPSIFSEIRRSIHEQRMQSYAVEATLGQLWDKVQMLDRLLAEVPQAAI